MGADLRDQSVGGTASANVDQKDGAYYPYIPLLVLLMGERDCYVSIARVRFQKFDTILQ